MCPAPSVAICVHVQLWLHPASPASSHCPFTLIVDSLGGCFAEGYLTQSPRAALHLPCFLHFTLARQSVSEVAVQSPPAAVQSPQFLHFQLCRQSESELAPQRPSTTVHLPYFLHPLIRWQSASDVATHSPFLAVH